MRPLLLALGCLLLASGARSAPLEVEPDELKPGLLAEYRSLVDPKAKLVRVDTKPGFTLGHSSPHPRLPAGPFEVTWTGVFLLREPGPIQVEAFVGGEVAVDLAETRVLEGQGKTDTTFLVGKKPLHAPAGYHRLTLRYRSLPEVPARLQLWWRGPSFAKEPIPA